VNETVEKIAELLMETGHAHHNAFLDTDGADPEWAMWYADYLYDKLPDLLHVELSKREIVSLVTKLDEQYRAEAPDTPWPEYYAIQLAEMYS